MSGYYYNPTLLLADHQGKNTYDITQLVQSIEWTSALGDFVGNLSFSFVDNSVDLDLEPGWIVQLTCHNYKVFKGMVTEIRKQSFYNNTFITTVTVHDSFFVMRQKMSFILDGKLNYINLCQKVFSNLKKNGVISDFKITEDAQKAPKVPLSKKKIENEEVNSLLRSVIEKQYLKTGKENFFYLYDDFGTITLDYVCQELREGMLIIGENSGLKTLEYSTSITDKTANKINVFSERAKVKKGIKEKTTSIKEDKASIELYGVLPFTDKIDTEGLTKEQINNIPLYYLKAMSYPSTELSLSCIGELISRDQRLFRAGETFVLSLPAVLKEQKLFMATSITHRWSELDYEMVIDAVLVDQNSKWSWFRTI